LDKFRPGSAGGSSVIGNENENGNGNDSVVMMMITAGGMNGDRCCLYRAMRYKMAFTFRTRLNRVRAVQVFILFYLGVFGF
jgi:hypothetical protein